LQRQRLGIEGPLLPRHEIVQNLLEIHLVPREVFALFQACAAARVTEARIVRLRALGPIEMHFRRFEIAGEISSPAAVVLALAVWGRDGPDISEGGGGDEQQSERCQQPTAMDRAPAAQPP